MAVPTFNSTLVARLAQAAYGARLGNATMTEALSAATAVNGGISGLMNSLYQRDFGSQTTAQVTATLVQNLGVPAAAVADATAYITGQLNQASAATRGDALISIVNLWSSLTSNAVVGAAVVQFNADIANAVAYSQVVGTRDFDLRGGVFDLDSSVAGVMRLTGNHNVRIDITRATDQVTGLDLNRNGVIEFNGKENVNPTAADDGKNFTVIDAYSRNALNSTDITKNYQGSIFFDGSGFKGDGTKTNGNIFLGGIGADVALGGIGNDFLAGGGARTTSVVNGTVVYGGVDGAGDDLAGGRNADFFFAELSRLSATDGNNSRFAGGTTGDDTVAAVVAPGGLGTNDNDWLLLEASDDDEPVFVNLDEGSTSASGIPTTPNAGSAVTTASGRGARLADMESVNASGNLYGFLNSVATTVGARSYDGNTDGYVAGAENYGRGSTAQLIINGTTAANALIGGYDNDQINGNDGNDLLMGGDLRFLITNKNNPNLLDAKGGLDLTASAQGLVFDGKDNLVGGNGNDNIVFESDNGTISGDGDTGKTSGNAAGTDDKPYSGPRFQSQGDTLWVTDFSTGRLAGAVLAGEATAATDAMAKLTTDSAYRIDLGTGNSFKNYGGAATSSQDTTNYAGTTSRVAVSTMESVNTTGLGAIDYRAAGSNTPELKFNNQQNYNGLAVSYDLRGSGADNALLANSGNDTIEGRGGDDVVSGGGGNDRFLMSFGDGIDWNARPVDANGDGLWDTTGGLVVASGVAWGQDFRPPAAATAGTQTLIVDFGATTLNGVDTFVATFQVAIDGKNFGTTIPIATLAAAKNLAEVASIVNSAFTTQDKNVTAVVGSGNTIEVRVLDATPLDPLPVIGTTSATGFFVTGQASGVGTYQAKGVILGQLGTNLEDDRLVIKTYDDRSINLGTDQTKNEISQAAAMVANFGSSSTVAQGQTYRLYLDSVREGDTVSVTINGTVYSYTLKAGEFADQAAAGLANAVTTSFDVNAASGTIGAAPDTNSFGDSIETGGNQAGVLITQTFVNNSAAYMNISASVTRSDGATPFGAVNLHEQSNTMFQMLGFDGRNGALFSQDKDSTPVILFQGRNIGTSTMSVLLTAKDTGGVLNGSNANQSTTTGAWINGDDLLYGGLGNDDIRAGTGDDRIIASKGVDKVDGGGDEADGSTYTDVLQAEEATFGAGTQFTVTLDPALFAAGAGKGTLTMADSKGVATGDVTTFSNIELVRTLENTRTTTLNVKGLSDSIAVAVGTDQIAAEGLDILLTRNPSTKYSIDSNGNGVISAGEITTATAVLGAENVIAGNANDRVTLDQTQLSANNSIDLGAHQDNTVAGTLAEGANVVTYDHRDINNDGVITGADLASAKPTMTIAVSGPGASTVKVAGGALGATTTTDTLKGVDVVVVTNGATSSRFNDVIDVSALAAGATVNYGGAETVGKSLGGQNAPVTTVAQLDANTLDAGGIALSATLGSELQSITSITLMERVTGSAGDDRVIVGNTMQVVATPGTALAAGQLPVQSSLNYTAATGALASNSFQGAGVNSGTGATVADQGLYQFNLGAGKNDAVDYKQETGSVTVIVDSTAADTDTILVDARADSATGVERYFGGSGVNQIDLVSQSTATTIQFSKEAKSNNPVNEFTDPAGTDGVATDVTRGVEVRNSTDNTVYANFMDRTGAGGVTAASFWTRVIGSNAAETVVLTDNETATTHTFDLRAGANRVDYSALTTPITVAIGPVNVLLTSLLQTTAVPLANDTITNTRTGNVADVLTIAATTRSGDVVNITGLVNGAVTVAPVTVRPTTSQVDPLFHVVNLATGTVTESLFGQYTPSGAAVNTAVNRGFVTNISGFENATNTGSANAAHLLGDGGRNSLTGGTVGDYIYGARGTAGDGSADVGIGNRGDLLTGGTGADFFVYKNEVESPGGALTVEQDNVNFGSNAFNVVNSRDTITDFLVGTDKLTFAVKDSFDVLKANGVIPANLAGNLNSIVALTTVFSVTNAAVNLGIDQTLTNVPSQADNYSIDFNPALGGAPTDADLIIRAQGSSGGNIIDASAGKSITALNAASTDFVRVDIVYTAAVQSQGGGFDQIVHFTTGQDKIDLSFLKLPRYESTFAGNGVNFDTNGNNIVDAMEGNAIRALGAAPIFAVNGAAPNMFIDSGVYKPIATQSLVDGNGDPSTTVFIDANGDGNYDPTLDMVTILVGVTAPVTGDFIFNQYGGGWGG